MPRSVPSRREDADADVVATDQASSPRVDSVTASLLSDDRPSSRDSVCAVGSATTAMATTTVTAHSPPTLVALNVAEGRQRSTSEPPFAVSVTNVQSQRMPSVVRGTHPRERRATVTTMTVTTATVTTPSSRSRRSPPLQPPPRLAVGRRRTVSSLEALCIMRLARDPQPIIGAWALPLISPSVPRTLSPLSPLTLYALSLYTLYFLSLIGASLSLGPRVCLAARSGQGRQSTVQRDDRNKG